MHGAKIWLDQITLLEPGSFQTEINMLKWTPPHPAYLTSSLPSAMRADWASRVPPGNTSKAVDAFYRVAEIPEPPLHFVLGTDAIPKIKSELAELGNDLASYESWSDDVGLTPGEGSVPEAI